MKMLMNVTILTLLLLTVLSSVSSPVLMKAKLHEPAYLSCQQNCSGTVEWIIYQSDQTIARCNQTSCDSAKGFKMIHEESLKGNVTLVVLSADYKDRRRYVCQCDGTEICRVSLVIEPIGYFINAEPGGSFSMNVSVPESVKVMFISIRGDQRPMIDEISERKLQVPQEYKERVSFKVLLTLKDLRESDSGVYTVLDPINGEVISTYNLTVSVKSADPNPSLPTGASRGFSYNGFIYSGLGGLLLGIVLGFFVVPWILKPCSIIWRKIKSSGGEQEVRDNPSEGTELDQINKDAKASVY